MNFPENLQSKIEARKQNNALRELPTQNGLVDLASNDYIGFAKSEVLFDAAGRLLAEKNIKANGATGSRLLSGNHSLYAEAELQIAAFHNARAALIFNSGYDANLGFFSSVPQKGDLILYDELCHASIRDGIRLSNAKAYKYAHNDTDDLTRLIEQFRNATAEIYIATESVFSMDGDTANLEKIAGIAEKNYCRLVVDEAHAIGVFGEKGEGLVCNLELTELVFARVVTFGKALGCHGAAVLGSDELKSYLVNFARSFIYTTGMSPHSVAAIISAYQLLDSDSAAMEKLRHNINSFNQKKQLAGLKPLFVRSKSAIQCAIIPGNEMVRNIAAQLQLSGFDVRAILSPTVPAGQERLRFCLHSYNSQTEIEKVIELLAAMIF